MRFVSDRILVNAYEPIGCDSPKRKESHVDRVLDEFR